jgi:hypothetical protein
MVISFLYLNDDVVLLRAAAGVVYIGRECTTSADRLGRL